MCGTGFSNRDSRAVLSLAKKQLNKIYEDNSALNTYAATLLEKEMKNSVSDCQRYPLVFGLFFGVYACMRIIQSSVFGSTFDTYSIDQEGESI